MHGTTEVSEAELHLTRSLPSVSCPQRWPRTPLSRIRAPGAIGVGRVAHPENFVWFVTGSSRGARRDSTSAMSSRISYVASSRKRLEAAEDNLGSVRTEAELWKRQAPLACKRDGRNDILVPEHVFVGAANGILDGLSSVTALLIAAATVSSKNAELLAHASSGSTNP